MLNPLDREALRERFRTAKPFPFIVIDNFLAPGVAEEVAASYPSFERALEQGFLFKAVNEQRKIQVTDSSKFPDPVQRLNKAISSPQFLSDLEYITGIPRLLADDTLDGGGMHLTGTGGRLDVHVDFNLLEPKKLHRRLNILVYLNPVWREEWGGHIELWDAEVKHCHQRTVPALNRCLIFETSNVSYHGVAPVTAPPDMVRHSFAAYYYTAEAPAHWTGTSHSTIFKARPNEKLRGFVQMPVEKLARHLVEGVRQSKRWIKSRIGL